jgi:leader peptidase (prepilin peptidase)/N-methyltransferase
MLPMAVLSAFYVLLIGAVIGSFLNVVIHRYPRGESVVFPPSACPHCGTPIRWFDNIPILNYIVLRGRCRTCRGSISLRYPLVEAANALFYLAIFLRTGVSWMFALVAAIVSMTIALIYIDADIQILPDVIDLPGIVIGVLIGYFHAASMVDLVLSASVIDAILGAAVGGGILWLVAITYQFVRKMEGMGLGDVKMLAMIGGVLGIRALLPVMLIASISGAIVGGVMAIAMKRSDLRFPVPFGIFLGFAAIVVLFFGRSIAVIVPMFGPAL